MKKFLIVIVTAIIFATSSVYADGETAKIAEKLKNSGFFTDYKDLNTGNYKTEIQYNDETIAIIGKHKEVTDYVLYYEYDKSTGILTYEITDLVNKTDELALKKHIVAALIWNRYVIGAVNDYYVDMYPNDYVSGEFLKNFKTVDPCTLTLKDNGIEVIYESMNATKLSANNRDITAEGYYTSLKFDLKNGIKIDKGNFDNPLTNFDEDKINNPSTGVIGTTLFVLASGVVVAVSVISYKNVRKLKQEEVKM